MNPNEFLSLFLLLTWVVGLITATIITAFDKWGLFDLYDTYRPLWMPASCIFCAGFWISFLILAILVIWLGIREWEIWFVPFASAAVAKWVNK